MWRPVRVRYRLRARRTPPNERSQPINVKKVLLVLVVVFLGFWMFTDPNGLAVAAGDGTDKTWDLAQSLFQAIIDFVDAL